MKYNKGDLILVRTVEDKRITCIVVSNFAKSDYYYVYSIETDNYRLIYDREIECVLQENFDINFPNDPDFFELDYSFYEKYGLTFVPFYPYPADLDSDDEDDK